MCYGNHCVLNISNIASFDFNAKCCRKHDLGRWILRSRSINFDGNPSRFSTVFFLHFVRFLKEQLNMLLLQESAKVNETLDVHNTLDFYE